MERTRRILCTLLLAALPVLTVHSTAAAQSLNAQALNLRQRLARVGPAYKLVLDDTLLGDEQLQQLEDAAFRTVIILSLKRTKVSDSGVRVLRALPNLRTLDLTGTAVSDEGVRYLKNMRSLKELSLADTSVSDVGLYHLQELSLKKLDLGSTQVTDRGMLYLKDMAELRELHLGNTAVSDEGIVLLRGRPLHRLDLRLTNVTDGAVSYLVSFPLMEVILFDTKVTDQGITRLKRSLPAIRINGRDAH